MIQEMMPDNWGPISQPVFHARMMERIRLIICHHTSSVIPDFRQNEILRW